MKILVTGSKGQVGQSLSERLKNNKDVLLVDKDELDICDQGEVHKAVDSFNPDFIINAAAYTAVDKAEEEPDTAYLINEIGPRNLAIAAKKIDAVFIHISTDYVFDGNKEHNYIEEDLTNPKNIYGKSKLAGENIIPKFCEKNIILRTSWVFSEYGNNFVKTMLYLAKNKDQLRIINDQVGGPTYAGDIADTILRVIEIINSGRKIEWGLYHYSGYPNVSWYDFADKIFTYAAERKVIDKKPSTIKISTKEYPTPAIRPLNSRLECGKIKQQFNIEPSNWSEAISNIQNY